MLYLQEETVDKAVVRMRETKILQPCLFVVQGNYFLKLDNTAIPLSTASCFVEAVEQTLMSFFVFNVHYPDKLHQLFSFIAYLIGADKKLGVVCTELVQRLRRLQM